MKRDERTQAYEEIRFEAVTRLCAGETPTQVAESLGVFRQRVYAWRAAYRAGGLDALRARKGKRGLPKLNDAQIRWIFSAVTTKKPSQFKLPFALWSKAQVRALILKKYSIELCVTTAAQLLSQLGLSGRKPPVRPREGDNPLVWNWWINEFLKIKAKAAAVSADIFFADESVVRSDLVDGIARPAKGAGGRKDVARACGPLSWLNMISATSRREEVYFMLVYSAVTPDVVVEFLKRLVHGRSRPVFLIVNGNPKYRSTKVRKYVASLRGQLCLITGLNLDEKTGGRP